MNRTGKILLLCALASACLPLSLTSRGEWGRAWAEKKTMVLVSQGPEASADLGALRLIGEGAVLLERRFFTRATTLLQSAVLADPENPDAWYLLGRAYEAQGLFAEAQKAYRRTLEIDAVYPAFSRVLLYPAEGERQPLWDPSRPARIEEIPVVVDGFVIDGTAAPTCLPPTPALSAPISPELGGAPVYLPPLPPNNKGTDEDDEDGPSTGAHFQETGGVFS